MEEVRPVIKVDIGESQKSVKGLKDEIKILKDYILNLEKGTKEYNDAVVKLQKNQRELDEVMSLTKKTATALDGSYDALTHQMSLLRKEWKATNDEAKRNELGAQIDEINSKLKEMDASTGNFQRNVGNYQSALDGVGDSAKKVSKEMTVASAAPKDFGTAMREMNEEIEPTKQKFEAVGNIASGLAGGFAAAQGAMALLGVESEGFEKTMIKVQSAMAIAQGVSGLKGLVEGLGRAKVAFSGLGDKIKAVSKTMGKAGWLGVILALITAVSALVGYLVKKNKQIKDGTTALKEYNKVAKEATIEASEEVLKIRLLEQITTDVTQSIDDRRRAAEELLKQMGKEITDTNILAAMNGELATEVDKATEAMIRQAIAAAQMEKLTELYKEYLELASAEAPSAENQILAAGLRGTVSDQVKVAKSHHQEDVEAADKAWRTYAEQIYKNTDVNDFLDALFGKREDTKKKTKEIVTQLTNAAKELQESLLKIADDDVSYLERTYNRKIAYAKMAAKEEEEIAKDVYALELEKEEEKIAAIEDAKAGALKHQEEWEKKEIDIQNQIAKEKNKEKKKQLETQLAEAREQIKFYANEVRELNQNLADEQLAIEQIKYDELERLRQIDLQKQKDLIEELTVEYQNASRKLAISTDASQEKKKRGFFGSILGLGGKDDIESDEAQSDIDNSYYEKAYEAEQAYLAEKLKLNQEFLAKATTEEERLDLEREIADIELQIDESKYAEKERLRQQDYENEKSKQEKIKAIFNASMQATADILGSLADMYESDEKNSEENAKKIKGLRIAEATINTINGAVGAFSQAAATIPPPAGLIVGGVQAAAVTAAGIANIMKIKNTKMDGSGSDLGGGGTGAATPSIGSFTNDTPYSYTRQLTGASEVDSLNQDTRVYILESDIQESNKKVQIRESESSF